MCRVYLSNCSIYMCIIDLASKYADLSVSVNSEHKHFQYNILPRVPYDCMYPIFQHTRYYCKKYMNNNLCGTLCTSCIHWQRVSLLRSFLWRKTCRSRLLRIGEASTSTIGCVRASLLLQTDGDSQGNQN